MLDGGILKENVDGEALLWASRRLFVRPETRKVLIVISDGAPVDQATLAENADNAILDRHLRAVIAQIEASGSISLPRSVLDTRSGPTLATAYISKG